MPEHPESAPTPTLRGYLLVDKPASWTSFDVVNKLRRVSGVKKVGHAGTLDPFATGLLIILLGDYTKKQAEFMKLDKTYEVTAVLGKASTTGDPEGELTDIDMSPPSRQQVEAALRAFVGDISQVPPAHSAIKVNGQRAYMLARQGKTPELEPRKVTIRSITRVSYHFPEVKFVTEVSSGTYIRSLVADFGEALDGAAYTSQLRRTRIGDYDIAKAESMSVLSKGLQSDKVCL